MERAGLGRMGIAIFPSLPTGLDPAVWLVGEAIQISEAQRVPLTIDSGSTKGRSVDWQRR